MQVHSAPAVGCQMVGRMVRLTVQVHLVGSSVGASCNVPRPLDMARMFRTVRTLAGNRYATEGLVAVPEHAI